MKYSDALDYMYSQLPMFQRIGAAAYKANLNNTRALDQLSGHPHKQFPVIHIAGTNGKGSVAHMLASILQESGFKTGLFTSPHLRDYRERIRVNGQMIPEHYVTGFVNSYRNDFEKIKPSFFEMTFALSMCYFRDERIDIGVIETGMGGRLDSTNILQPILSIITNIGYDHMQFLGVTLHDIAVEKAGIIKQHIPLILGQSGEEYLPVIEEKALEQQSPLHFADRSVDITVKNKSVNGMEFHYRLKQGEGDDNLFCPLGGDYQLHNLKTVLLASHLLPSPFTPGKDDIRSGIAGIVKNTNFLGRWQKLNDQPLVICDTAHNTDGLKQVLKQLQGFSCRSLHIVLGMVKDKDVSTLLDLFPADALYYFCRPGIPRGLDAEELQAKAGEKGLSGRTFSSVAEAFNAALICANPDDLVFIGGSTFVVAEVV